MGFAQERTSPHDGGVKVSDVDPVASMQAIDGLADVAKEVQAKLKRIVESL
jgi:hypothetical protein